MVKSKFVTVQKCTVFSRLVLNSCPEKMSRKIARERDFARPLVI